MSCAVRRRLLAAAGALAAGALGAAVAGAAPFTPPGGSVPNVSAAMPAPAGGVGAPALVPPDPAAPEPTPGAPLLGRLFATPEERALLDVRRNGSPAPSDGLLAAGAVDAPPGATPAAPAAPPKPPALVLDGVVRRSNGQSTVWLNQVAHNQVLRGANGTLTVRLDSGKRVTLRPGQRYDEADGTVKEDHEP